MCIQTIITQVQNGSQKAQAVQAYAAFKSNIATLNFLDLEKLHQKFPLNMRGDAGLSLYQEAIAHGADASTLLWLQLKGVKPAASYSNGVSLISSIITREYHRENRGGVLEGIKHMIVFGANINQPDDDGNTPLHLLISNNPWYDFSNLIPALVNLGANLNIKNKKGKTPLQRTLNDRLANNLFNHPGYKIRAGVINRTFRIYKANFRTKRVYENCCNRNNNFIQHTALAERKYLSAYIQKHAIPAAFVSAPAKAVRKV